MMGVSQQQHKMETGSTVKPCVLQMATLIGISKGVWKEQSFSGISGSVFDTDMQ